MSKHRAPSRLARRRARISGLGLAIGVTIAVGGAAVGVLPQLKADQASADAFSTAAVDRAEISTTRLPPVPTPTPTPTPAAAPAREVTAATESAPPPPEGSGDGRRIVFDESDQRVWLIGGDDEVARTYLVSGSRFDNLDPGSYAVTAKLRRATAFDYTGTMEYFVQFTVGDNAPIGFHSVPRSTNGELEQTRAQLGTPLSAGCVRQWLPDAVALWDFAPVGTKVVVTA